MQNVPAAIYLPAGRGADPMKMAMALNRLLEPIRYLMDNRSS